MLLSSGFTKKCLGTFVANIEGIPHNIAKIQINAIMLKVLNLPGLLFNGYTIAMYLKIEKIKYFLKN